MGNVLDLIAKLGKQESSITEVTFVSPIFHNTQVATRVSGLIHTFEVKEKEPGWYLFKPSDSKKAKCMGVADQHMVSEYLKYLPKIRVTLALKDKEVFLGLVEKNNNLGIDSKNAVPVILFDDTVSMFDRVICRYDGVGFWFDSLDTLNDPAKADYLRENLTKLVEPEKIKFSGLCFEEKAAYAFRQAIDKKLYEERHKTTLQRAVEHAGGKFIKADERRDFYSVTYSVDGHKYTSYVSKDPIHRVITSGICLAGNDTKFDLKSLITVMREAQKKNVVHRFDNTF
jgi:hypothetical protein